LQTRRQASQYNQGNAPRPRPALIRSIAVTLLPLPISQITSPSQWTTTLHGNISITLFLFTVRSCYFLGIGRKAGPGSRYAQVQASPRRKSHGQAEVPLPPARVVRADEEVVRRVEAVEKASSSPARRGKKA
jgi:hypothetical protein